MVDNSECCMRSYARDIASIGYLKQFVREIWVTVGVHPDNHSVWVFGRRAMTLGDQSSLK